MIPATFCAGMTLPLLTHELMRRGSGERAIGTIYSANTLGAIVGVLLSIHVLMPLVGVKGVILAGAGIHLALGLSRLPAGRRYPSRTSAIAMAAGVAVYGLVVFVVNLDPVKMASGVYRTGSAALPDGATRRLSARRQDRHDQSGGVGRDGDDCHQREAGCERANGAGGGDDRRKHHGARRGDSAQHAPAPGARREHRIRIGAHDAHASWQPTREAA